MAASRAELVDRGIPVDVPSTVRADGVGVIASAFAPDEIAAARRTVMAHLDLFRNTRPNPSSRHLAGFHRHVGLEPLHVWLTANPRVHEVLTGLLGPELRTIGLSDITVDRSQQWHKDLLRGPFRQYLDDEDVCRRHHGKLFKVIVYLQDSSSLRFVPGSHRRDIGLDGDEEAIPSLDDPVARARTRTGDAVIVDICTTHRGSEDEEFLSSTSVGEPRILLSTVVGRPGCEFADRMEFGNAVRLAEWQVRNR